MRASRRMNEAEVAMRAGCRGMGGSHRAGGATRRIRARGGCALGLLAAMLCAGPAPAESLFAREALGEWIEEYDARGETLGSTGIGLIDAHNFATINPAATAFSRKSMGHVGFGSSLRRTGDGTNEARRPSTYITGLGAHLVLPGGLGLRLTATPATDGAHAVDEPVATGWEAAGADRRRSEGSRGLLRYAGALTWSRDPDWALAAGLGFYAGSLRDEVSYAFGDPAQAAGWAPGEERTRLRFHPGTFLTTGGLVRPLAPLTLGAFVAGGARLEVTGSYSSSIGGGADRETGHVEIPPGYGAGAALRLGDRWRLSGDLVGRPWKDAEPAALARHRLGAYRNTLRWGVGVERLGSAHPRAGYGSTIAWRAGFAWIPWYALDEQGDGIDEWRASLGAGLPVQGDRGSIDLMLAWGRRGSLERHGIEESYIRFGFGSVFSSVPRGY